MQQEFFSNPYLYKNEKILGLNFGSERLEN